MAVPKRKTSSHRQGRRRATHKVKLPEVSQCPFCGSDKRPYFACPNCGQYGKTTKKDTNKEKKAKKNG